MQDNDCKLTKATLEVRFLRWLKQIDKKLVQLFKKNDLVPTHSKQVTNGNKAFEKKKYKCSLKSYWSWGDTLYNEGM